VPAASVGERQLVVAPFAVGAGDIHKPPGRVGYRGRWQTLRIVGRSIGVRSLLSVTSGSVMGCRSCVARAQGSGGNRAVLGLLNDGVSALGGDYVFCLWDHVVATHGELAWRGADRGVIVGAELDGRGTADQAAFATEQTDVAGGELVVQAQQPFVECAPSRLAQGDER
jgi:hypothetical protein